VANVRKKGLPDGFPSDQVAEGGLRLTVFDLWLDGLRFIKLSLRSRWL